MARTTKALSGGAKDKLLRGIVASTPGVPAEMAARISERLGQGIADVRVRRDVWEAMRSGAGEAAIPSVAASKHAPVTAEPVVSPPATTAPVAASFDPFAFSVVALLTRKGKPALAAALDAIETAENLHDLALAQHLAIDGGVKDPAALRTAIIAGAERRIAERKAAAS